jgi:hypothetical protein
MPYRGGAKWTGRLRAARAAANRPDLSKYRDTGADTITTPPTTEHRDWPAISRQHPQWWQVHRIELHGEERVFVLVYETPNETEAFKVALSQESEASITKWNDRRPAYFTSRPPRRVPGGPDDV